MLRQLEKRSHVQILDAVRAMAALAVLLCHLGQQFRDWHIALPFGYLGTWGVTIFFILSGFLIHSGGMRELTREGVVNWPQYARRRFFRIWPAYVVALILSALAGLFARSELVFGPSWHSFWLHFFLLSSFDPGSRVTINGVLWTVVVEAHFYLAYPLLIGFGRVLGRWRSLLVFSAVSIAFFLGATFLTSHGEWRTLWQMSSLALWWQWMLGAMLAEFMAVEAPIMHLLARKEIMLSCLAASLMGSFLSHPVVAIYFQRFVLPLALFGFLGGCVRNAKKLPFIPLLPWIGQISYSLYLFHPLAILVVVWLAVPDAAVQILLACGITLVFSVASYYAIERPCIRWGHRGRSAPNPQLLGLFPPT